MNIAKHIVSMIIGGVIAILTVFLSFPLAKFAGLL